jgi:hypothetical protein
MIGNENGLTVSIKSSIIGFHDPKKHHGLRLQEFLDSYLHHLASKRDPKYRGYERYVREHEPEVLTFIRRTLSRRLRVL